jgi:hypothetical protein
LSGGTAALFQHTVYGYSVADELLSVTDGTNLSTTLAWVQSTVPDYLDGRPVLFFSTFLHTIPASAAFPLGGDPGLLPDIDLELWGLPTSAPLVDATNSGFVFLRWQRGVMLYDQSCACTQGVLLGDYLKGILTGASLPPDLAQEAATSPLLDQYDPSAPSWVHNPTLLPGTDFTHAFDHE